MVEQPDAGGDAPRTRPPPAAILAPAPVLALGAFAIGLVPHVFLPLGGFPTPWNVLAGGVLVVAGLGVRLGALRTMRRNDTSPAHEDEPAVLLTDGPFQYTRNPIYLGVVGIYLGLTVAVDSLWPLVPLVVLAGYFNVVARREEAYLDAVFGDEFRRYAEDVRRWL